MEKAQKPKKKAKSKIYFTQETEDAIVLYNKTTNSDVKNQIFNQYLNYPLSKLVENVIHTYKFYNTGIAYSSLFDHILEYLIEKLYKINTDRGKAFSYLTVTARNYGILLSKNNLEKSKREFEQTDCYELDAVAYTKHGQTENQEELSEFFDIYVKYINERMKDIFPNKEEIFIAQAFMELFDKRADIDIFNKKALYIIIKEKTRCESRFITNVVNILKVNFYDLFKLYRISGLKYFAYYTPVTRPYIKRRIGK